VGACFGNFLVPQGSLKVLGQFLYMGYKLKPTRVDSLGLIFQNYYICKPKFQQPLMNITFEFFKLNVSE